MKKFLMFVPIIIFSLTFMGCENMSINENEYKKDVSKEEEGILEKVPSAENIDNNCVVEYKVTSWDKAPEGINNIVSKYKGKKGYFIYSKDKDNYIIILSGKKTSGGHSISVSSVEKTDNTTVITIEEKSPSNGEVVIQAITYPYIILNVKCNNENLKVLDTLGNEYTKIEETIR